MRILGIDYGRSKIGLAISTGNIAEPYKVFHFNIEKEAIEKVEKVVEMEKVERIVVGISEGEMAKETKKFADKLSKKLNLQIKFYDETLSTQDAIKLTIESGIKRKKRKQFEDAFAAAVMLQSYLDNV